MSLRGPRGNRGRGRGTGRGRGRGGSTMLWEWDSYRPGADIYDRLWHIRRQPVTVTPRLSNDCPIPNAQTQIKDRRQTEGKIQRYYYVVEIVHFTDASTAPEDSTEIMHVDFSRVLEYVSPYELERYENDQFRIEAEAEAVATRAEAEQLARRTLEKNVKATTDGSKSLSDGPRSDIGTRARARGRGRGQGRGSWRGRGALTMVSQPRDDMHEELVDAEPVMALIRDDEDLQLTAGQSESDDDDYPEDVGSQVSPGLTRSAFVANSALPTSPVLSRRRLSGISGAHRKRPDTSQMSDSGLENIDTNATSMSSASTQLHIENDFQGGHNDLSEAGGSLRDDGHKQKKRRTVNLPSTHIVSPNKRTPSVSEPRRMDSQPRSALSMPETANHRYLQPPSPRDTEGDLNRESSTSFASNTHIEPQDEEEDEDMEEYVVEAILEHYREAGRTYYLVKWQGYEDSHDWLPEEDLDGAVELVADYNAMVRQKKAEIKAMR